jgi:hypothetical protein
MKTPTFTPEYEAKLKQLRIKTKFVKLVRHGLLSGETFEQAIEYLNSQPTWSNFIFGSCDFARITEEERVFWTKIAMA